MLEYQSSPNKDPYANLIMQAFLTNASIGAFVNMVYLKPEVSPAAFSPFYSIPTVNDTTKIQTLTQMINGQLVPPTTRFDWFTTSFRPSASLYPQIESIMTAAPNLAALTSLTAGSIALAHQPISASAVQAGSARGGNALGLEYVNQTWFTLDTAHWSPDDDEAMHDRTRGILAEIENSTRNDGNYLPYRFMNDASYDQDVIGSYGAANMQRLKAVQEKYDPDRVFQTLAHLTEPARMQPTPNGLTAKGCRPKTTPQARQHPKAGISIQHALRSARCQKWQEWRSANVLSDSEHRRSERRHSPLRDGPVARPLNQRVQRRGDEVIPVVNRIRDGTAAAEYHGTRSKQDSGGRRLKDRGIGDTEDRLAGRVRPIARKISDLNPRLD
ncbi:MAG: hypothetical protein Q9181_005778 [Wetmoreana brouardii]